MTSDKTEFVTHYVWDSGKPTPSTTTEARLFSPRRRLILLVGFLATGMLSGCGSNLPSVESTATQTPATMTFSAPPERLWTTTQGILAAEATFKVLDRTSMIMVTEFKTVESRELSLIGTYFLGKTYKNNYTVTFVPSAAGQTTVRIAVGLQSQQLGFLTREADEPAVAGHLRKSLFNKIAAGLKAG